MTIKIKMHPHPGGVKGVSGIDQVVLAYAKHLPDFDIEIVHPQDEHFDLVAGHTGTGATLDRPFVCHTHGLHWTADYECDVWQYGSNKDSVDALRKASAVTVPSVWVAETFQRDMRFTPHIIPHGIDADAWTHGGGHGNYILWNKNRGHDVCDASPVVALAQRFRETNFVTTFLPRGATPLSNVSRIGIIPHEQMKQRVQNALVYLATTKETFGIGTLEAMASGVPVLGFAHGGNVALVEHGVNGYLAKPGDMDDLAEGLNYCIKYRDQLGKNGQELARAWTWERAVEMVAGVYRAVLEPEPPTVAVVIPCYNLADSLERTVKSVCTQTYFDNARGDGDAQVIVVDDGSEPGQAERIDRVVQAAIERYSHINIRYIRQGNSGVAIARNRGVADSDAKYICCLDGDDAIHQDFIGRCIQALEADRSLGIAYTGLWSITPDGNEGLSHWPGQWDYDAQLLRRNQVPTCCVFRRKMWERLGGYRQRYAPQGAGEEDAEFWLRAGAYGYKAQIVDQRGLFIYSHQSGRVSGNPQHRVTNWTGWHPWAGPDGDGAHPFASYATPERHSHPVRQYDEPTISVVIPVGPGHEQHVFNALDSLEAQTFRQWEVVVVDDSQEPREDDVFNCGGWSELEDKIRISYPYARHVTTRGQAGAGYARNRGAEIARAPLLVFLDADDWLRTDAFERMLLAWNEHQAIIYSDYTSKAIIKASYLQELQQQNRLHAIIKEHDMDGETWYEVAYKSRAFDYECERAQRQPSADAQGNYYIWCNVTALIPKTWHDEVGGFDEELESWEDVDYHWRMSKLGKCYHRIEQELLVYNFHMGHRRERGRQEHKNLLYYISEKHKEIEIVACRGCGKRNNGARRAVQGAVQQGQRVSSVSDDDFVECWYIHPSRSNHQVTGAAIHNRQFNGYIMIKRRNKPPGWSINYRTRAGGGVERFLVHKDDVKAQPQYFQPIESRQAVAVPEPEKTVMGEPPKSIRTNFPEHRAGPQPLEMPERTATREPTAVLPNVATPFSADTKHAVSQMTDGMTAAMPEPLEMPAALDMPKPIKSPSDSGFPGLDDAIATGRDSSPELEFNLQTIPGIGGALAVILEADGIYSKEDVLALGVEGLQKYKGVGEFKATMIIKAATGGG